MSLRRGFKAEANRISLRLRFDLGLAAHAPMGLSTLATHLGIQIVTLRSFSGSCGDSIKHLTEVEPAVFSAMTIALPRDRHLIVYNDRHAPTRCNNSIAHEISHVVLKHKFTLPIDNTGTRAFDRDIEDEANWLGPTILISNEAAFHIVQSGMNLAQAARFYGVSSAVLNMRVNGSGARIRFQRSSRV